MPSNALFEVQLVLIYKSTSGTPDIQVRWSPSGDYEVFHDGRVFIGTNTTISSFLDVPLYMNNHGITTPIPLGTLSGGEMPYYERMMIKTGSSGCKFQLKWAQNVSSADYISVMPGSYIMAWKL